MQTERTIPSERLAPFRLGSYCFRIAEAADEIEQIHRLLYRTFVLEIGQYPATDTGRHVDKFHHKNTYLVAVKGDQVKGVLAVHDQPPFSVADALPSKETLERLCPQLLEVRLLAVEPGERGRQILGGFMVAVHRYVVGMGYRHLAISGLAQRQPMYRKFGFCPLGHAVQRGAAQFVPMLLDLTALPDRVPKNLAAIQRRIPAAAPAAEQGGRRQD